MSYKTKKYFQITCRVLCAVCFFLILGTAGASDTNVLEFSQIFWRGILYTAGLFVFALFGGVFYMH